jgi:glucose/arabinose dehydrogenase
LVDQLPNGRHNTNGLAVHEGVLYITNGNATDDGTPVEDEAELSGTLLSLRLTDPLPPLPLTGGDLTIEAKGMRNIYDVAFRAGTNEAWLPMNGPDAVEPYGEDLLLKTDTAGIGTDDFGFPECLYGPGGVTDWVDNTHVDETCTGAQKLPEAILGLHVSADGLAFDVGGNYLYIALFGNFFGDEVVGHRVVRVPIDDAGNVTGEPRDVIVGGAPLDVWATLDGIYVADFATGQITLVKPLD